MDVHTLTIITVVSISVVFGEPVDHLENVREFSDEAWKHKLEYHSLGPHHDRFAVLNDGECTIYARRDAGFTTRHYLRMQEEWCNPGWNLHLPNQIQIDRPFAH